MFLAFSAGSLLLFAPMLGAWFQEDDYDILAHVASRGPFGMWTFGPSNFFRPVISLTFWVQHTLFGLNPIPYRVFNDLVHAGVATLVGVLGADLLGNHPRRSLIAWMSGGLFLVMASHAEAVDWIAARTDLVSAFFGLLALVLFRRGVRESQRALVVGAWVSFAVGLFAKESVLLVPFIAATLFLDRDLRSRWRPWLGFLAVIAVYVGARVALMGTQLQGNLERSHGAKLLGTTAVQMARIVAPGLPFGNPDVDNVAAVKSPAGMFVLAIGIGLVALAAWAVSRTFSREGRTTWVALAVLGALPALGLSVRLFRSQGERFVYLPSVSVAIGLSVLIVYLWPKRGWLAAGVLGLIQTAMLDWQHQYWVEGAKLSQAAYRSFVADVVPSATGGVTLMNVPGRVQGGYGIAYEFPAIGRLAGREFAVRIRSVETLVGAKHRNEGGRSGDRVWVRRLDDRGGFNLYETYQKSPPTPSEMREDGVLSFTPDQVEAIAGQEPTFFWDGQRFHRL